jgi:hypothetical protein
MFMPFVEHYLRHGNWLSDYPLLFSSAWRNVVKLASAGLFVGVFWALLGLWGGLFKILGITFFTDLFTHRNFVYPATALAISMGLSLYSAKEDALVGIYRATLNLLGWLLPLVSGVMVLFVLMLPFKGLSLLWKTGYASSLMLGLLGLQVHLLNAAWQDGLALAGHQIKFNRWIKGLINASLMVMPIFTTLCAYAVYLRVQQYGFTNQRVWGALLVAVAALYSLGYAWQAICSFTHKKDLNQQTLTWLPQLSKVNMVNALLVIGLLILTQTPVLNPSRISTNSQMARLYNGKQTSTNFDFGYLRFHTGRYGERALKKLSVDTTLPNAKHIQTLAKDHLSQTYSNGLNPIGQLASKPSFLREHIVVYPAGKQLDQAVMQLLADMVKEGKIVTQCVESETGCPILAIDLNNDNQEEWVFLDGYTPLAFTQKNHTWQFATNLRGGYLDSREIIKLLKQQKYSAEAQEWNNLIIGDQVYKSSEY